MQVSGLPSKLCSKVLTEALTCISVENFADTTGTPWITTARAADLPHLHAFTRGLDQDRDAVRAALALPYHNGGTEGVNTKTKRIMRQMHGRAGFTLLRHHRKRDRAPQMAGSPWLLVVRVPRHQTYRSRR
jgi:hypothetical protein